MATNNILWFVIAQGLWLAFYGVVDCRQIYNVADFGALGNARNDDTQAFLKAWTSACGDPNYPTFLVPSAPGKTFLLGKITFWGPCKAKNIHVEISGNIIAPNYHWTSTTDTWITFINLNGLIVNGQGYIDGNGGIWWPCQLKKACSPPYTMQFLGCNGLHLGGINLKNGAGKHIALDNCQWVKIHGITITSPGDSPNTDGILIFRSQHVHVSSSTIATGDDCLAIGPGCYDVNVTKLTCGPGHGISIGSLGVGSQVEKIRISNCNIFQSMNGVRIKTRQGGSGYAKNIVFEHINFNSVGTPIVIDQYYCPDGYCSDQAPAVAVSDVTYFNLNGTSVNPLAIKMECSRLYGCDNVVMNGVNLAVKGSHARPRSYCRNARGKIIGNVWPKVPCLTY